MQSKPFFCRDCGSSQAYRSRARSFFERFLLPLVLLRPVRCADCFRRCYAPVFVEVKERKDVRVSRHAAA
jgi:hypothetical protein